MDQRRQMFSALVAVACFFVWMQVAPLLFPGFFPEPKKPVAKKKPAPAAKADNGQQDDDEQAVAKKESAQTSPDADNAGKKPEQAPEKPAAADVELPEFPAKTVILGQPGFDDGFLIKAELTTQGAGIKALWLTDPRYTTADRKFQLQLIGSDLQRNVGKGPVPETFETSVPAIDKVLDTAGESLASVNWEIVKQTATSVTFRYPSPAGDLEVLKTFSISKSDLKKRDESASGYLMDIAIEIRNLTDHKIQTQYTLQGPVGVPLENAANTRVFREIKLGTLENPRYPEKVTATSLLAAGLVKQFDKAKEGGKPIEDWRAPIHYAGVDDQFFASLVLPQGNQFGDENQDGNPDSMVAVTKPQLLYLDRKKPEWSSLSLTLESPELKIPAKGEVSSHFQAFFGPKRPELMRDLNAEAIIQLGWFAPVAKVMLLILGFFHSVVGLPYAAAIIALTILVRGLMMPISRKQAIEAEKMKILAPKMKELQEKYKSQPEEFARAYKEFQRKHNYHPMLGCLPALIQLPIFLGLYNSLYHAVDLRLAQFLWIDNLAAPDRMAELPFTVPYFGWTEFNLLPFITVALFVAQQKLFTPPPTSDEQAMQYKMMNVMMIAIGFAFYRVPAGLCLYFISSSLWGVCERLFLKKSLATHQQAVAEAAAEEGNSRAGEGNSKAVATLIKRPGDEPGEQRKFKAPGWWDKIRDAADQAKNNTEAQASQRKFTKDKKGKGTKPRR